MLNFLRLTGLAVSLLTWEAYGWWDAGHMMVAAVAHEHLKATDRIGVIGKVNDVLGYNFLDFPESSSFISSATWADKIKCSGDSVSCRGLSRYDNIQLYGDLHYSDVFYDLTDGDAALPDGPAIIAAAGSVPGAFTTLEKIKSMILFPTNSSAYGTPYSYNLYVRLMIHIVGDIHQPLHTCALKSYFTSPEGDAGGNGVRVSWTGNSTCGIKNLHSLWDSVLGSHCDSMPAFTEDMAIVEALRVMESNTAEGFGKDSTEIPFESIFPESYSYCVNDVYPDVLDECCVPETTAAPTTATPTTAASTVEPAKKSKKSKKSKKAKRMLESVSSFEGCHGICDATTYSFSPSQAYLDENRLLAERQIALAGYRLAYYLDIAMKSISPDVMALVESRSGSMGVASISLAAVVLGLFVL